MCYVTISNQLAVKMAVIYTFLTLAVLAFFVECRDQPVPSYIVNLDEPPQERWSHVVSRYADLYPLLVEELYKIIPRPVVDVITEITGKLDGVFPAPYGDEIRGIAKYTNSSVGETLMGNLAYDFTAFYHGNIKRRGACTSILALNSNGTLLHGRNLDYAFKDLIRNFTIDVEFHRGGTLVFRATTFAGMVGVFTGMRPGGLSISLDQRNRGFILSNIIDAVRTRLHGMVGIVIRDVLSDPTVTYASAVKILTQTKLIAPCYLIVGGPGQSGVVITRDRSETLDVWSFNVSRSWYLVETNYDHWEVPPESDDRRDATVKELERISRDNITMETLYEVLSTYPILNKGTAYTTLMSSGTPVHYSAVIRYPD